MDSDGSNYNVNVSTGYGENAGPPNAPPQAIQQPMPQRQSAYPPPQNNGSQQNAMAPGPGPQQPYPGYAYPPPQPQPQGVANHPVKKRRPSTTVVNQRVAEKPTTVAPDRSLSVRPLGKTLW